MTDTTVNAGIAHGLYTEGDPIADTKAPAGPDRRQVDHPQVRGRPASTPPTAASST